MKVTLKRADWERILIVCAAALVVVLALRGGGDVGKETLYEEPPLTVTQTSAETSAPVEETLSTVCFYQDGEGYLIPVTRQIPKQDGIAKATLALMVKSSQNDMDAARMGLRTIIPEGTSFDIDISGGNKYIFLLIVNIVLLIAGCFLDSTSALYIFTPLFAPVALQLGIDPIHLGTVMIVNLAVGRRRWASTCMWPAASARSRSRRSPRASSPALWQSWSFCSSSPISPLCPPCLLVDPAGKLRVPLLPELSCKKAPERTAAPAFCTKSRPLICRKPKKSKTLLTLSDKGVYCTHSLSDILQYPFKNVIMR